jgi:hypothetical protein
MWGYQRADRGSRDRAVRGLRDDAAAGRHDDPVAGNEPGGNGCGERDQSENPGVEEQELLYGDDYRVSLAGEACSEAHACHRGENATYEDPGPLPLAGMPDLRHRKAPSPGCHLVPTSPGQSLLGSA